MWSEVLHTAAGRMLGAARQLGAGEGGEAGLKCGQGCTLHTAAGLLAQR